MIVLICLSALLSFVGNLGLPIPAYRVVLDFLLPFSSVLVTPLAYWGSFGFLSQSKHFAPVTLVLAVLVGLLNYCWFVGGWADGLRYQGADAVWASVTANVIGFGAAISLALLGLMRRTKVLVCAAYLCLLVVLTWCAFPFLSSTES